MRAASHEYTIVPIAQNGASFSQLTYLGSAVRPGIDDTGRVFFLGKKSSTGTNKFDGLYVGSGVATAPLYSTTSGVSDFTPNIRVSPNGYATFSATTSPGFEFRRGNGGAAVTMVTLDGFGTYRGFSVDAPVNNSGDALLSLRRASDDRAVIARYSGTTLTPIAVSTLGAAGGPYSPMAMNLQGTALYGADGADADASSDELFTVAPSGSPVSRFSVGTTFKQYLGGDLDDANVITFTAYTLNGRYGLYRQTGPNQFATLIETSAPSDFIGEMYANNAGLVAFRAAIDGGTHGMYVYDPTTESVDPVLLLGQTIGTSTITQMSMGEWNSAGQIPIAVKLADGTEMIVRADPVPEPAALGLFICMTIGATRRRRVSSRYLPRATVS